MNHSTTRPLLPATSPGVVMAIISMYDSLERQELFNIPAFPKSTIHALSKAPFHTTTIADTSFLICAEECCEDSPIIAATVQPKNAAKVRSSARKYPALAFHE